MTNKNKLWLHFTFVGLIITSASCLRKSEGVLLRFSPQIGNEYPYIFKIHHPQSPIEISAKMQILSKDESGYHILFPDMSNELFPGSMIITERFNSNHPGFLSLNFPDDPVIIGDEWSGEVPWYYEDYYVLGTINIHLPASYKLLSIEQQKSGRYAVIEQRIEAEIATDELILYIGQVGVQWDIEGKITEIHEEYDAYNKLNVGDVVIGINQHRIEAPSDLHMLAENYIQHPKVDKIVTFTVQRNGQEYSINVEKTIIEFAVVTIQNKQDLITIMYDIEREILHSASVSSRYDVVYTSPTAEPFQIVDDFGGFHKFGFLSGKTSYKDHIDSDGISWSLSIDE
jgi:hypothetical protein